MDRQQPERTSDLQRQSSPGTSTTAGSDQRRGPGKLVGTYRLSRGLDLPLTGAPMQQIDDSLRVTRVALVGPDYHGMRPTMEVEVGHRVKAGQLLFSDKKTPGVIYTAPGAGTVAAINRGQKRTFLSLEIELDEDAHETFPDYTLGRIKDLDRAAVVENLLRSGFWTSLRTRPLSKVPSPESTPRAVFVTAMDTNPLAADPSVILAERPDDFEAGLAVLSRLGGEHLYLCKAAGATIPGEQLDGVETAEFAGPHPAGLPGTHIHFLAPVGRGRTVWYANYQDVMAIGRLFLTGKPDFERVVSLAGPGVADPRLVRTRLGANLTQLTDGQLVGVTPGATGVSPVLPGQQHGQDARGTHKNGADQVRVVSGSLLDGRKSQKPTDYLGRYHLQISVLAEPSKRELFGWIWPGFDRFSLLNVVASKLLPGKKFAMTTAMHGGHRAIVPMGMYEMVMPLDILPTFLLKALASDDLEQAEALGCLELDEEDLALCTFVCPGKGDYGAMLRKNLTVIEKEG